MLLSHPVWVRGLKHERNALVVFHGESHPVWVRGLKQLWEIEMVYCLSRTPCGCVD